MGEASHKSNNMKLLILFAALFVFASAQTIEDDVLAISEDFWEKIEKEEDGFVGIVDFILFFCRYDTNSTTCLNSFRVDEDMFAEGWMADFEGYSEPLSRALFKRFVTSRLDNRRSEEILTLIDLTDYILYLDQDGDGFLSYLEFVPGFALIQKDLAWGTMFVNYRNLPGRVANYDDACYIDRDDEGWDQIFRDSDDNDNGELDPTEFIRFGEVNQYYGPITAVSFFDQCNYDGEGGDRDGVVDFEEWRRCFDRLNFADPEDALDYDDFVQIDRWVSPIQKDWREMRN